MINMFYIFMMISILVNLMMMISLILSKKVYLSQNKVTPFECGFSSLLIHRMSFFMHFFFIAMIFLIFDVEIIILLPLLVTINMNNIFLWLSMLMYFILILIFSIFHEWNQLMIDWTK